MLTPALRSVAPVIFAAAACPALAQPPTGRLPLPPAGTPQTAVTSGSVDQDRFADRRAVAVADVYIADASNLLNDQSGHSALLGSRLRDRLRSLQVVTIPEDVSARASSSAEVRAAAPNDIRRAAGLVAAQTAAEVVVVLTTRPGVSADSLPLLSTRYTVVDARRDAIIDEGTIDIAPAAGRTSLDADRIGAFASILAADIEGSLADDSRGKNTAAATDYSRPLPQAPAPQPRPATALSQQPVVVQQQPVVVQQPAPIVVQQPTVVVRQPVYVREPVYVQEPVYVPASSWSVGVGYGWGSGAVGVGYASPGYCAPRYYRPYCGPSRWGGWGGGSWCGSGSSWGISVGFRGSW